MINKVDEEKIINAVISALKVAEQPKSEPAVQINPEPVMQQVKQPELQYRPDPSDEELCDITEVDLKKRIDIDEPANREMYLRFKDKTPARLGIGKAGPRYRTFTMLRLRADLAAAKDAVQTLVSRDFVTSMNIPIISTMAKDKSQYLLRPDLGRTFDEENDRIIKDKLKKSPDVQIVIGDGLSSTAIEANIRDILPSLQEGLKLYGIDMGTPVFVEYARVGAGDYIADRLGAKLVIVLIGERPGVASSESMSCYMTYGAKPGITESARTVISNIHRQGTPPVEAGAHIAELADRMLKEKKSGVDLVI